MVFSPHLTQTQIEASRGSYPPVPAVCVVTGGTGFVGSRVVEMLVERGAKKVVSFDVVEKPEDAWDDNRIQWVQGDITDKAAVMKAIEGADCVWHIAAAVGPFHPKELYRKVNFQGTMNVIEACRYHKVPKLVFSSSPSTRFDGSDVDGLTEEQLPKLPQQRYLQEYAATKAMAELAVRDACCPELLTIAVAPHQVYGPRDNLFLPNLLEAAGTGKLRIFGNGMNRICFTHVDNYAHGLIISERALTPKSPALGKFYIITDGDTHPGKEGYSLFWKQVDEAVVGMGFASLWGKMKLPLLLLYVAAHLCDLVGWLLGKKLKLNPFNVKVLTMHRWFRIGAAETDLGYKPLITLQAGWSDTIDWFRKHWLPGFDASQSAYMGGIAKQSQQKIDVQASSAKSK